jgi:signal transduction histidine kinase/AmiR/NasT family two-component response regulator
MPTADSRRGLSLQVKAIAVVLVIVILAIGVSVAGSIAQSSHQIASSKENAIQMIASGIAQASELPLMVGDTAELTRLTNRFLLIDNELSFLAVYDRDGRLVANAVRDETQWQRYQKSGTQEIRDQFLVAVQTIESIMRDGGPDLFEAEVFQSEQETNETRAMEDGQAIGRVIAAKSLVSLHQAQQAQARLVLSAAGVLTAGIIPLVYFIVGRWTRRISRLVEASQLMAEGKRSEPIQDPREDEIGLLVRSFEVMRQAVAMREQEQIRFNATLQEEVRKRTADLEEAMHTAEAASRAKTEFLANMSHEIRTPMTSILGYAELMEEPNQSSDDRLECVQTINRNAGYLLSIINDILDISKIEAGKMTVESIKTAPVGIVADVASLMRGRALEHGLDFSIEYRGPIPESIHTDPTRLRQVLMNLCGNAIKFTEKGGVKIVIQLCGRDDLSTARMRFAIIDTGIGLTSDQIDRLFQPFSQGDGSMTRRYGGTGLGLTISRRLARLLGGDIEVESEPHNGSTFTLEIPVGDLTDVRMIEPANEIEAPVDVPGEPSAAAAVLSLDGLRVLLAEDGLDNQRLIRFHVSKAGAKVEVAENGEVALNKAVEASEQGEPFDVILMDMQMPVMDGYAATNRLRDLGYDRPIIALTAHAMSGDRERCLNAGCDDYTTKPINRLRLIRMIRDWSGQRSKRATKTETADERG